MKLITRVTKEGQACVDEPIHVWKKKLPEQIGHAFKEERPDLALTCKAGAEALAVDLKCPFVMADPVADVARALEKSFTKQSKPLLVGHERVTLRWMKPGPDGKLVPR